ncbi:MAG TPA: PilZ domain-containing protein [bacterium]|nr:hypothetical protein [Myxococcales bacterium]OQA60862.1 MAG: PilZ domain protein [bacterium ADurb.Bin270]HPW45817.1 PilZ domain-containing protein [bacterium]HQC51180.1 PilZ domain-containing protein [bacterium]HQG14097.1 PilZ domain-containing protein [bacterium]
MAAKNKDLRSALTDAHAYFYILKGDEIERLKMWDITEDSIVIDLPLNSPLRKTVLGFIPTLMGTAIYEVEGEVSMEPLPDQMEKTVRVIVKPSDVKKINRRLFPRYNFTPPIGIIVSSEQEIDGTEGKIVNISAGGARIEMPEQLRPEMDYIFEFDIELDDEMHSFIISGKIVYEIPMASGYSYGVRFGASEDDRCSPTDEVPIRSIDRTVDLMALVNKLTVRGN